MHAPIMALLVKWYEEQRLFADTKASLKKKQNICFNKFLIYISEAESEA